MAPHSISVLAYPRLPIHLFSSGVCLLVSFLDELPGYRMNTQVAEPGTLDQRTHFDTPVVRSLVGCS
jgi:hypothetical protein